MAGKRFSLWLCILALTLGFLRAPVALAMTLEEPRHDGDGGDGLNVYQVTLDARVIGDGETLSYADIEVLPGDAIADLLDRVTVWPDGRLEVSLKFTDELPALAGTGLEMKVAE